MPPRAALRPALAWAATKRGWIEAQLAKLPAAAPVAPGMIFEMMGQRVRLDWSARLIRGGQRFTRASMTLSPNGSGTWVPLTSLALSLSKGGCYTSAARVESLPSRVTRWLKGEALAILDTETRQLCAAHNLTIATVGVGDPRGRWGSCSSSGAIRYSWRLILAPAEVLRATVAHEVAHLTHLDHSPAFHAEVARLYGRTPNAERRWLKSHGTALHWFGRDS